MLMLPQHHHVNLKQIIEIGLSIAADAQGSVLSDAVCGSSRVAAREEYILIWDLPIFIVLF